MANRTVSSTSSLLGYDSFKNTIHAANIAIWDHYADIFFGGDLDRIIYCSSDFAFRKRTRNQTNNNLNLPFMSFKIAPGGITNGGERNWWNMGLNTRGMFIEELQRKIRLQPIEIEYDSKLFVHKESDAQFAMSLLHWDDSNETLLTPEITIEVDDGTSGTIEHTIKNIGVLRYNADFTPDYNESDWLEKNKIRVIDIGMSLETFMILEDFRFGLPTKVIMDFAVRSDIANEDESVDIVYEKVLDRISEEAEDLEEV